MSKVVGGIADYWEGIGSVQDAIGSLRGLSAPSAVLQTTPTTSFRQSSAYTTPSQTVLMRVCSQQTT